MEQVPSQVTTKAGEELQTVLIQVDEEFNKQCIESHNELRALHGCPPIEYDPALALASQEWAEYLAHTGMMKHSPNEFEDYGENIAMRMIKGKKKYKGRQASMQWYSEIEFYDFDLKEIQPQCGHFSQLVWMTTQTAGFGKAFGEGGKMFAVGQYRPPGNTAGLWHINIPRPLSGEKMIPTKEDLVGKKKSGLSIGGLLSKKKKKPATKDGESVNDTENNDDDDKYYEDLKAQLAEIKYDYPTPEDTQDRLVRRVTKRKTLNGERKIVVVSTYQRTNGLKYEAVKETIIPY